MSGPHSDRLLGAQADVTSFQDECSRDLAAAEPIIAEAEAALNSLDKASLGELKSFGSPAAEVVNVVSACMVLTAPGGRIPKVCRCSPPSQDSSARTAPPAAAGSSGLKGHACMHALKLLHSECRT